MVPYSEKIVRCNFCMHTFLREKDVEYSYSSHNSPDTVPLCPDCKKGHLWLINMRVNEEQLKKDKYNRKHPSKKQISSDAAFNSDVSRPDRSPNFGTRLKKGFEMLEGGSDE
jgi:hypothetical protein